MKHRPRVLAFLILLFAITYIDRVCISVAGPRMQAELGISPVMWGWVTTMFTLSYCLFEIPTGALGDRIGPRRVLTRVVTWWSVFTSLTGDGVQFLGVAASSASASGPAKLARSPMPTIVIARWFPARQRASISGVMLMASQIGGALAPLLIVPIQMRYGWRASFIVFGASACCGRQPGTGGFATRRARCRESPTVNWRRYATTRQRRMAGSRGASRGIAHRARPARHGVLLHLLYSFFQTWLHTFLVRGRGFGEASLLLSAMPYTVGAGANLLGGTASDALVRRLGPTWGRRTLGLRGTGERVRVHHRSRVHARSGITVLLLSLIYGAIALQQSGVFGVCLDIGGSHAGRRARDDELGGALGGLVAGLAYGYIVEATGSYDAPFVPMAVLLGVGTLLWLRIDAARVIGSDPGHQGAAATVAVPARS